MSTRFSLNKEDLIKIGKGFLIAVAGAALTYIAENVAQVDFGEFTPIVIVAASVLVNAGRKFLASNE